MPASLTDEWKYWDTKLAEVRRGQTAALRTSATKWAALLTALLGAFSAVAFAGGLTKIDDLETGWASPVKGLTTVAALASIGAIVILSFVSGGLRVRHEKKPLTAKELADEETNPSKSLIRLLLLGRGLALVAAACVVAGSVAVLWAPQAPTEPTPLLVTFPSGTICARPSVGANGALTVSGRTLDQATRVLVVTKCPAK